MTAVRDGTASALARGFRTANLLLGTAAILLMLDAHDGPGIACVVLASSVRVLELRWRLAAKRD